MLADSELQPQGLAVLQENLKYDLFVVPLYISLYRVHANDKDIITHVVQLLKELTKYGKYNVTDYFVIMALCRRHQKGVGINECQRNTVILY